MNQYSTLSDPLKPGVDANQQNNLIFIIVDQLIELHSSESYFELFFYYQESIYSTIVCVIVRLCVP